MAFPRQWRKQTAATGDLDGDVAGTTTGGTVIPTNEIENVPNALTCKFLVDAETNTLTITAKWQVSDDNTTFFDLHPAQNPANVALATGTAGADAAVERILPCPEGWASWKYVRPAVVCGVATGTTSDTYSMESHYLGRREF